MKALLAFLCLFWTATLPAQTALLSRFDSLTAAYEAQNYHGVILVAKGDQVLYQKAYGLANFEKGLRHTPQTLFKTESVGKMFTATAIMQLVEQGKLRLDQTVRELLPALNIKNANKITIHHLLGHTSGLQSPWDHPLWNFKKRYTRPELEKIITEVPLALDSPGKSMYYSNSGYYILGWIIERVSGQPYDEYFQQHFFTPLQMTTTRHLNDTLMPQSNGAQPYRLISSKKHVTMSETLGPQASPAGGWISSAGDLYRFMRALQAGKLVKPQTLAIMQTANNNSPKDSAYRFYGYGLETYRNGDIPGSFVYGHNGGGAGFSIDAYSDAVSGYTVVSCTNLYQDSRPIAFNYLKAVLGQPLKPVSKPPMVLLYDRIGEIGIDAFMANPKEQFAALGVPLRPGWLVVTGEAMEAVGDYATWAKWMDMANRLFPNDAFLTMIHGDSYLKAGNKESARKFYLEARELGTKKGDQRLVQAATEKLNTLQ